MTHQIVGFANELVALKAADLYERGVCVGHAALGVGHRHEGDVIVVVEFSLGDGLVVFHDVVLVIFWGMR